MFRKLKKTLHQVGPDATRRRKRRYAPNLGESAAILEDRQLLSGAGEGKPTPAAPPVAASAVRSRTISTPTPPGPTSAARAERSELAAVGSAMDPGSGPGATDNGAAPATRGRSRRS